MEFQLLKTAASNTYILPRIGVLCDLLDSEIAEMYTENEPGRPELAATARFLAEHFRIMDPETKLFTSMSSTEPGDLVNRELLKFTNQNIADLIANIAESSIELTASTAKKLLGIVIGEAVSIAYILEIRSNPEILLTSKIQRSADGPIVRTAADVSNKHEGVGRKIVHAPWQASEQKAPSTRDIRDIYAMLAYNSAFNAFVTAPTINANEKREAILCQMAMNFETAQYFDAILASISRTLKSGKKVRLGDGTPLTPNPSIGAFFGADHKKFFATSIGDISAYKPSSILQIISHGSKVGSHSSFLPYSLLNRKEIYGSSATTLLDEEAGSAKKTEEAAIAYAGIAGRTSMKTLSSRYASAPEEMSKDLSGILLRGFNTHISMLRSNGIPLDKYSTIIPSLADANTKKEVRQSLINIVASMPQSFESMEQAKAFSKKAIEKEHTRLSGLGLSGQTKESEKFQNLVDFAAQIVLRLPVSLASALESFDPREMLRPVPPLRKVALSDVATGKSLTGVGDVPFDDIFSVVIPSAPSGGAATFTYNQLAHKDQHLDFFILAAKQKQEFDDSRQGRLFDKLKFLTTTLQADLDAFVSTTQKKRNPGKSPEARQKAALQQLMLEKAQTSEGAHDILKTLVAGALASIGADKINAAAFITAIASNDAGAEVIKQVVEGVAKNLPATWNSADPSRIESDFNNVLRYARETPELYSDPSTPFNKSKADLFMLHEGSFHTALHTMVSNGMVARYDQNRDEHNAYVDKVYNLPEIDDDIDVARVLDTDTKAEELRANKILDMFIPLQASDVQKYRFSTKERPHELELARKRQVGLKFQDFFNKWSKSSIIARLYTLPRKPTAEDPRTTYGADYFDAFNVLLARRFYELFDNYIDNKLEVKNIGARAGQAFDEIHERGAQALAEIEKQQNEGESAGKSGGDEFAGRYTSFAREWAVQPRFAKSTGGFDTQSLAGFMSECLVKKDIAQRGGTEGATAAKFVDRLVMPLDAKRFKRSKDSNPPILGMIMNRAVWAYGKITQTKNVTGLQRMLADNIALGRTSLPSTMSQVAVRVGAFVDPIVSAESLAKGNPVDTRNKALQRAMVRTSSEFDNYEDWENDMISYMRSYRAEVEANIGRTTADESIKKAMLDIVDQSAASNDARFSLTEEQKNILIDFSKSTTVGEIKNEVLWKDTFKYAIADIRKSVSVYFNKSNEQNIDKTVMAIFGSRPIKQLWQENIQALLGPGGIVEKTDAEKYALSIVALMSIFSEDPSLLTALISAPQIVAETAQEMIADENSSKEDAEEADLATEAADADFGQQFNFKSNLDQLSSRSSKMQALIGAILSSAPDVEESIADPDQSIEQKTEYIAKIFSMKRIKDSESGKKFLISQYSSYLNAFADGGAPESQKKQIDKASEIRPKDYLVKLPVIAPDVNLAVLTDIENMLATVRLEFSKKVESISSLMQQSEKADAQLAIQKQTVHMAELQRLVYAGRELAMAQAPVLPTAARYKLAIKEFADYNEKRINEWNKLFATSRQLAPLIDVDDKLRNMNSSLDRLDEKAMQIALKNDAELIALALDPVVKRLFAVRGSVAEKSRMVNDLRVQLSEIDDSELEAFHDSLRTQQKQFMDDQKKALGPDIAVAEDDEDLEFVSEDDVESLDFADEEDVVSIDEELSSVPDIDGRMLSNKELDERRAGVNALKKSVVVVKSQLSRPAMKPEYKNNGKTVLTIFETQILSPDFISKNSAAAMKQMDAVMADLFKYLEKGVSSAPLSDKEETQIMYDMQNFVDRFGKILDAKIRKDPKAIEVAPVEEQVQLSPSPSVQVGSTAEQDLNAEIDATSAVIKEEMTSEPNPAKKQKLQNILKLVESFGADNRNFSSKANIKEVSTRMEMLAKDVANGKYNQFTVEKLNMEIEIWQARGFKLKQVPDFSETVMPSDPAHIVEMREAGQTMNQQAKFVASAARTFLIMDQKNVAAVQAVSDLKKVADHLSAIAALLVQTDNSGRLISFSENDAVYIKQIEQGAHQAIDSIERASKKTDSAAALAADAEAVAHIKLLISRADTVVNYLKSLNRKASVINQKVIKTGDGWLLG